MRRLAQIGDANKDTWYRLQKTTMHEQFLRNTAPFATVLITCSGSAVACILIALVA